LQASPPTGRDLLVPQVLLSDLHHLNPFLILLLFHAEDVAQRGATPTPELLKAPPAGRDLLVPQVLLSDLHHLNSVLILLLFHPEDVAQRGAAPTPELLKAPRSTALVLARDRRREREGLVREAEEAQGDDEDRESGLGAEACSHGVLAFGAGGADFSCLARRCGVRSF